MRESPEVPNRGLWKNGRDRRAVQTQTPLRAGTLRGAKAKPEPGNSLPSATGHGEDEMLLPLRGRGRNTSARPFFRSPEVPAVALLSGGVR